MADDPELQRRLDAMFASAQPRAGFEDELWRRLTEPVQDDKLVSPTLWGSTARRAGWGRSNGAYAWAGAAAAVLLVLVGTGYLLSNLHPGGGVNTASSGAASPAYGAEFGLLPRPLAALAAPAPKVAVPGGSGAASNTDAGPAYFTGVLPALLATAPVYRYAEPSAADRAALAARLEAGGLRDVTTAPSDPVNGIPPSFRGAGSNVPADAAAAQAAISAPVVTADGQVYGVTGNGNVVSGPLDLTLDQAPYPIQPAARAVAAAGVQRGPAPAGERRFDSAQLVYLLVVSKGHGYYEPELLLSGPGGKVLVSLVDPVMLART
jgi:hypothetical protein